MTVRGHRRADRFPELKCPLVKTAHGRGGAWWWWCAAVVGSWRWPGKRVAGCPRGSTSRLLCRSTPLPLAAGVLAVVVVVGGVVVVRPSRLSVKLWWVLPRILTSSRLPLASSPAAREVPPPSVPLPSRGVVVSAAALKCCRRRGGDGCERKEPLMGGCARLFPSVRASPRTDWRSPLRASMLPPPLYCIGAIGDPTFEPILYTSEQNSRHPRSFQLAQVAHKIT